MEIVNSVHVFFVSVLHGVVLVSPNYIYAAVIALFFGLITKRAAGVFFIPVLATVVFLAALMIGPVVLKHEPLVYPTFDLDYAKHAGVYYVTFLVAGGVVFAIKKLILKIFDR
jgi:hypothetical protein